MFVGVEAVRVAGRLTIDEYAERHRRLPWTRAHDKVDVSGVEAEVDPALDGVEDARPTLQSPIPCESPMVQIQPVGRSVGMSLVEDCSAGRCEASCLLVAEICFGRPQARPVGRSLQTGGSHRYKVAGYGVASGLAQQPLDDHFAFCVSALAELMVPDSPFRVGDVDGGPKPVGERLPDRIIAIDCDRIVDGHVLDGLAHVVNVAFKWELRSVDPDHDQPLIRVPLGPGADIGECAKPVDAGVGPEVDKNDLPVQIRRAERRRVEPGGRPVEAWQVTLDG
jgi:hypothetical protein